jgi:hypothetical protein
MRNLRKAEKKANPTLKKPPKNAGFWQVFWYRITLWSVTKKFWQRLFFVIIAFFILSIGSMYGIARWYIDKYKNVPLEIGATFVPNYASYFELDPKVTMAAMIDDLGLKRLRLVSYWSDIEKTEGSYDFSSLDWQFKMAEVKGVKVSLALGLRQPRWPECHMPAWAQAKLDSDWYDPLKKFIAATVERYKDSPVLDSYQLENEYFLKAFGLCYDFSRDRLVSEYNLVKSLDPDTPLIVSMSNNAIGTPIGDPRPDMWAISVYKRVWDKTITQRYFEYPIPAWYYAFRAGFTELTRGRQVFIHELQTEAWTPETFDGTKDTPISEQYKSMDANRLRSRIEYGKATGMRTIDVWGVEWWYWLKTVKNEPAIWDAAREEFKKIQEENERLLN